MDDKVCEYLYFDEEMFKRFKRKYKATLSAKHSTFVFEGHEILVDYAKYVIQYVESEMQKHPNTPKKSP